MVDEQTRNLNNGSYNSPREPECLRELQGYEPCVLRSDIGHGVGNVALGPGGFAGDPEKYLTIIRLRVGFD